MKSLPCAFHYDNTNTLHEQPDGTQTFPLPVSVNRQSNHHVNRCWQGLVSQLMLCFFPMRIKTNACLAKSPSSVHYITVLACLLWEIFIVASNEMTMCNVKVVTNSDRLTENKYLTCVLVLQSSSVLFLCTLRNWMLTVVLDLWSDEKNYWNITRILKQALSNCHISVLGMYLNWWSFM